MTPEPVTLLRVIEALSPLLAVGLAAYFAPIGYRAQRTIDRRLAWYERTHAAIQRMKLTGAISSAYVLDEPPHELGNVHQDFIDAQKEFMLAAGAAPLFAEHDARSAVLQLRMVCEQFSKTRSPSDAQWDAYMRDCQQASDAVAAEIRRLMQSDVA